MIEAFCTLEMANVAATVDRRCTNDNSLVIAPSTSCAHRQWLGVDGWSACLQERPCPPRPADAWRAILSQQAKAVERRNEELEARRAARRRYPTPEIPCPVCSKPFSERLSRHGSTRKTCSAQCGRALASRWVTASRRIESQRRDMAVRGMACVACGEKDRPHKARGLCPKCWQAERRRSAGAKVYAKPTTLIPIPCPVCKAPFKRVIRADGQRQQTCSKACGIALKTGRRYLGERWSRAHDACVQCGENSSPHKARGTCLRCYERERKSTRREGEVAA